ncbi:MAG: carbohydrate kinase family protein [Nocardioidaceae bacterium]
MSDTAGDAGAPPGVVVLGELCVDIVVELADPPVFGQTETVVPATSVVMGSSSAITACGLARMGVPTEIVGVVGDDLFGGFVRASLAERGVATTACRVDPALPTGSSTILTRPDGDRSILTALGSIGTVTTADVPEGLLAGARHVHVGSYFLQYAVHGSLGPWFARCRERGLTTSLDPNFDPAGTWDAGVLEVLPHVDVLFCNEQEACGMAARDGLADATSRLLGLLPPGAVLVLKRGPEGAEALLAPGGAGDDAVDTVGVAAPAPAEDRPFADAVGAGDSLAAGFLAARLRGLDVASALAVGVANGTASTRATGGVAGQLPWDPAWD